MAIFVMSDSVLLLVLFWVEFVILVVVISRVMVGIVSVLISVFLRSSIMPFL